LPVAATAIYGGYFAGKQCNAACLTQPVAQGMGAQEDESTVMRQKTLREEKRRHV
jgi:hypothetical protein